MDKKENLKEVKIYLDAEIKDWLQQLAKEQGKSFRTFLADSLIDLYSTAYLEKELAELKRQAEVIRLAKTPT